ncbi:hypothetical protein ACWKSP_13630 [Micromonosporaceae bacterium Da 78-11]
MSTTAAKRMAWADVPVAGKIFSAVLVVIAVSAAVISLSVVGSHKLSAGAESVYNHGVWPTRSSRRWPTAT